MYSILIFNASQKNLSEYLKILQNLKIRILKRSLVK